jgi:hypothetical protein
MKPYLVLQHDPSMLFFLDRLHLGAAGFAVMTFVLLPFALHFWCRFEGTLRVQPTPSNPDGHGLYAAVNAYFLILPVLNFSIARYYEVYSLEMNELVRRGILPASHEDPFLYVNGRWGWAASAVSAMAAVLLAAISFWWNQTPSQRHRINWLFCKGKPRRTAFWFHVFFFCLQMEIIFDWVLRHWLIWKGLIPVLGDAKLQPFSPDGIQGMDEVSNLYGASFLVITLLLLFVAVWLLGSRITMRREGFRQNPGHAVGSVCSILIAIFVLFYPMLCLHGPMVRARAEALHRVEADVIALRTTLDGQIPSSSEAEGRTTDSLTKQLGAKLALDQQLEDDSTWPLSKALFGSVPFGLMGPVLLPLLAKGRTYLSDRLFQGSNS